MDEIEEEWRKEGEEEMDGWIRGVGERLGWKGVEGKRLEVWEEIRVRNGFIYFGRKIEIIWSFI